MKLIKQLIKKKYTPMERRDSYKNFINKMKQYTYMKYSNSNSDFVHKIKTEIFQNKNKGWLPFFKKDLFEVKYTYILMIVIRMITLKILPSSRKEFNI